MSQSILRAFPEDFAKRLDGLAVGGQDVLIPLIKHIDADGVVTYDERHARKRPDWTFED